MRWLYFLAGTTNRLLDNPRTEPTANQKRQKEFALFVFAFFDVSSAALVLRPITLFVRLPKQYYYYYFISIMSSTRVQTSFKKQKVKRTYAPTTAELNEAIEDYLHTVSAQVPF